MSTEITFAIGFHQFGRAATETHFWAHIDPKYSINVQNWKHSFYQTVKKSIYYLHTSQYGPTFFHIAPRERENIVYYRLDIGYFLCISFYTYICKTNQQRFSNVHLQYQDRKNMPISLDIIMMFFFLLGKLWLMLWLIHSKVKNQYYIFNQRFVGKYVHFKNILKLNQNVWCRLPVFEVKWSLKFLSNRLC